MSKQKLKGVISFYTAGWQNVKMPCEIELQQETNNSSEHKPEDSSVDYSKQYLTLIAKSDGTFKFSGSSNSSTANTIQYSTNNGEIWSEASQVVEVNVQNGDKILWKGEMTPLNVSPPTSFGGVGYFSASTASFDIEGNIMSLLYGDNFVGQVDLSGRNYAFRNLFQNTKCVNADNFILPATTLAPNCYECMFKGCTYLTTAPQLLATTLSDACYNAMFRDCTSLSTAPSLLSTTLVGGCYWVMFSGCSNLNYIKMLATDISANNCLNNWVDGVAADGVFIKNDLATWNATGDSGVPTGWTVVTESESEVVAKNYQITQLEARVAALEQTLGG